MNGPLDGLRILELSRYIAAPYAGKLLADLGAEVIKVEEPGRGDPFRGWQAGDRPYSPQFAAYNRNKKSITVDLKSDEGIRVVRQLLEASDVLIENFRPGVMQRLGLDWDRVFPMNERIVYCSITGFGHSGPYVKRASYDSVISAMSGLYSQILNPESPQPMGPAFSDLLSGVFAAQGVLAALMAREKTGKGQLVDASMLSSILGFLTESATTYLDTGEVARADTRQRRAQAYGMLSKDGLPFVVHLSIPDKFWKGLTDAIERPELVNDERFVDRQARYENYYELDRILKEAMAKRTREEWFRRFEEVDLPHAAIQDMGEVFEDPQVQAMDLVEEVPVPFSDKPLRMAGYPIGFSDTPRWTTEHPPTVGEQTDEILQAIGYSAADIKRLREIRAV